MIAPGSTASDHIDRIMAWVDGAAAPTSPPPHGIIADSWKRCVLKHRLDPATVNAPNVLTPPELRDHVEPVGEFLGFARESLLGLHAQLAASGYVVLLADRDGVTIERFGSLPVEGRMARAGLERGAVWAEDCEGTNGVGTCLASGQPILVHRFDHFAVRHTGLTCSVAPILGPVGELLAALDVSSLTAPAGGQFQSLVHGFVMSAARQIEDTWFLARTRENCVLALARSPEMAGIETDAMIAVDPAGTVVGLNGGARKLFAGRDLIGARLDAVLETSLDRLAEGTALVRQPGTERRWAVSLRPPLAAQRQPSRRPPARSPAPARPTRHMPLDELAGGDPQMQAHVRRIRRFVDCDLPILMGGETGTGKEAFARAIHDASARAARPFVGINCAALPESLIESELFGYAEGAFTGARRDGMRGKLLQADGGTLFLDEIGDMPLAAQTRLLRVLAEREVIPLGGDRAIPLDLHVICASHHDLEALVASGAFRADLFYRLNGLRITLPPLRERTDKAELIDRALELETSGLAATPRLTPEARSLLLNHDWPGNIRQLRTVVRAAVIGCEDGLIRCDDLPLGMPRFSGTASPACTRACPEAERLQAILRSHKWCVADAARSLNVSRMTLYRRMAKFGVVPPNQL
ncbi:sigma-54-dependent Fis family transcriptional regulator [Skermanella rosea]|uniref:sigma-54-dependent Fis family transcriptional regulator n=1 Tax=Skermanella rosea TaxID=1817965 RepID=UPI0019327159|nr:sigma-54-dependent Fis family transcriptional regulator [Skermanella rosea]UEM06447.1 sigma-54-dependent Fis family transcriptional regulator [Skermanella rosea]